MSRYFCRANWAKSVKDILTSIEMESYWTGEKQVNIEEVTKRLMVKQTEVWKEQVKHKPKLRTMLKIVEQPVVAKHVTCNISKSQQSLIQKLRDITPES